MHSSAHRLSAIAVRATHSPWIAHLPFGRNVRCVRLRSEVIGAGSTPACLLSLPCDWPLWTLTVRKIVGHARLIFNGVYSIGERGSGGGPVADRAAEPGGGVRACAGPAARGERGLPAGGGARPGGGGDPGQPALRAGHRAVGCPAIGRPAARPGLPGRADALPVHAPAAVLHAGRAGDTRTRVPGGAERRGPAHGSPRWRCRCRWRGAGGWSWRRSRSSAGRTRARGS